MTRKIITIAIIGSRTYPHKNYVDEFVSKLNKDYCKIISGGANGVDSWAIEKARSLGFMCEEFFADWNDISHPDAKISYTRSGQPYDRLAGFRRNTILAERADIVVAFWDENSSGTLDTITKASFLKKKVVIFGINGQKLNLKDILFDE